MYGPTIFSLPKNGSVNIHVHSVKREGLLVLPVSSAGLFGYANLSLLIFDPVQVDRQSTTITDLLHFDTILILSSSNIAISILIFCSCQ